ncbi:PREDICTED: AT-hook motif [Prunus dulcis]|uniref:AT-hook motif nuclear-localized protein n=1 Tax=Prunus dulcis TaxID=3755 RepID=A0A5E4FEW6_PRUDU|nr:PREDICTED: AT-hook motif [Prunus dulcis]
MDYFPQTPQTSQIESESGSNLDSNEEEEISVKRKMGTPMTYGIDDIVGELDHYALTVQTGEDVVSVMFSLSQRTSRSLWILSATGAVLDVVLRKPDSSGGLLNFQA